LEEGDPLRNEHPGVQKLHLPEFEGTPRNGNAPRSEAVLVRVGWVSFGKGMGTMRKYGNERTQSLIRGLSFLLALFSASPLCPQQSPLPNSSGPTMRVTTHLVLVDVVVSDKHGNHVTDLAPADFTLLDHGKPQKISVFSGDHARDSSAESALAPPPSPLPPRVFTNAPAFHRPTGPPTVLLLDGLNTTIGDQLSSHEYMLRYLRTQLHEGQSTAILALNESLVLLQDFTTDPRLLIAALEKSISKKSDELSGGTILKLTPKEAEVLLPEMLRKIDSFNQSRAAEATDMRVRVTLASLRSIARALGGFTGRKNLIWVSSVFPFSLQPDAGDYPDAQRGYGEEIRRTAALLASAQVAVYTVDARGLIVGNVFESNSSQLVQTVQRLDNPQTVEEELANSHDATIGSHQTMQNLAKETGGMALYNQNDITHAVAISAADGAHYYTLGFYPDGGNWDGKFHRIEVKIDRDGLKVRHRSGYFAVDAAQSFGSATPQQSERQAYDELRRALADPLPATELTFHVRVPQPDPAQRAQLQVQFLVDSSSVSFDEVENGLHHCNLDFMVAAISPDGKLIASDGHTVDARLKPDQYAQALRNGVPFSMQLSIAAGTYSLHLAVRDNRTGLLGTLAIPLTVEKP
jgi:VWFA-related protein